MTPKSGRVIAWLSFLLGIAVSIAGNVGHAASDGMRPGEWAGAAFWPTALMLSIEILTRVRWQPETRWKLAKVVGLTVVATGAAVLSYRHLAGLLTYWGEDAWNAHIGPLVVDGMMLLAATALLSISKERDASTDAEQPLISGADVKPVYASDRDRAIDRMAAAMDLPQEVADEAKTWEQFPKSWERWAPPEPEETPDPVPAPEPPPSKLHVVNSVSTDATESAAMQAFFESNGQMRPQDLMEKFGMSRSTAYRRRNEWQSQISGQRIAGR